MSRRYGRVDEQSAESTAGREPPTGVDRYGHKPESVLDRIATKIHAAFWVALAVIVTYYGGVVDVALTPAKSNIYFLVVGAGASGVVFAIFMYLVVYLPYIARINVEWSVYAPPAIPTATGAGVVASLWCVALVLTSCVAVNEPPQTSPHARSAIYPLPRSFVAGIWPTYGLLSPLVIFSLFMGLVMVTHFIPVG